MRYKMRIQLLVLLLLLTAPTHPVLVNDVHKCANPSSV